MKTRIGRRIKAIAIRERFVILINPYSAIRWCSCQGYTVFLKGYLMTSVKVPWYMHILTSKLQCVPVWFFTLTKVSMTCTDIYGKTTG
jgi:hypothetical protein